jgi:2-hydroxychromene-2-carboxylate isomerase
VSDTGHPRFYYDLRDPECYLWAERVNAELPEVPEWVPVSHPPQPAFRCAEERASYEEDLARRAARLGLQPLRLPAGWPAESDLAPLAATYAKQIGRAVAFSLAAFRQAFAAGRDLDDVDTILIAAAACELHPNAVLKGIETKSVKDKLRATTEDALARGLVGIPTVAVGDELFWGDDRLEEAVAAVRPE